MNPFDPQQQTDATHPKDVRFVVEVRDEYGWADWDRFPTAKQAVAAAQRFGLQTFKVIDSQEQALVFEANGEAVKGAK